LKDPEPSRDYTGDESIHETLSDVVNTMRRPYKKLPSEVRRMAFTDFKETPQRPFVAKKPFWIVTTASGISECPRLVRINRACYFF
jgi:hypothetical protein